jgi:hypothetical protein
VSAAQAHNYEAQAALTFESQTLSVLGQARRALDACAKQMLSAKDCSTWGLSVLPQLSLFVDHVPQMCGVVGCESSNRVAQRRSKLTVRTVVQI